MVTDANAGVNSTLPTTTIIEGDSASILREIQALAFLCKTRDEDPNGPGLRRAAYALRQGYGLDAETTYELLHDHWDTRCPSHQAGDDIWAAASEDGRPDDVPELELGGLIIDKDASPDEQAVVGLRVDQYIGRPLRFENFRLDTVQVKQGDKVKTVEVHRAMTLKDAASMFQAGLDGWPRRTDGSGGLFVARDDRTPRPLSTPGKLFAWIKERGVVDWKTGSDCITQEDVFEYMSNHARSYESVETMPHWPPRPRSYYMHPPVPMDAGHGALDELVDFFAPATPEDRCLIKALVMTPFWGGEPGDRPAFLITGPARDRQGGRGVGKSTLPKLLAPLAGGSLEVSTKDDISGVKTRLLSAKAASNRIGLIDNLKVLRFSWAELEGLITATEISGHQMYQGEGKRSNLITWILTVNGPSMSRDMAQRTVAVSLARPEYDATWADRVRAFIEDRRQDLLADIGRHLQAACRPPATVSRWGAWEAGVLAKAAGDRLAACQQLIRERQEDVDADDDEQHELTGAFRTQLEAHGHDPDVDVVAIPTADLARWYNEAHGATMPTNRASAMVANAGIAELIRTRTKHGRSWVWRGAEAGDGEATQPLGGRRGNVIPFRQRGGLGGASGHN